MAPGVDGDVIVSVPADVATDSGTNGNLAATDVTVVSDRTAPTTVITTTVTSPTNASTLPFTVTFSEDVTGFVEGDVVVANGTISNFTAVDAKTYTFDVTPTIDGDVTVSVAAAVATDAASNDNAAATDVIIASDRTAPTTTITTTAVSPSNSNTFAFTVTFSEDVGGFVEGDVVVANGTISNFTAVDAKTYTFDVAPTIDGDVTVSVAAGVARDAAGNDNSVATDVTVVSDRTAPTPVVSTTVSNPTSTSPIPFTVTFNEDVTGFAEAAIIVVNGTVSNFQAVNGSTYTFDVTPTIDGDVTVSVASNFAVDAAGNQNNAGAAVTVVFDSTDPTGTIAGGVQQITGTASDISSVTGVRVSIHNGTAFWDGTGFNSTTEMFFDATSTDNFVTWSFAFTTTGTFTVNAEITDAAGNIAIVTNNNVTVS